MTSKSLPASGGSYTRAKNGSLKKTTAGPSAEEQKANVAAEQEPSSSDKEA